ncbi:GIN domain-containing protein [Sphingomonas sp. MMS24-JH45]
MTFAQIAVGKAELSIAGSGRHRGRGQCARAQRLDRGSGNVAGKELTADQADVKVAGSGNVTARGAAGPAKVRAFGSGDVDLGPDARCDFEGYGIRGRPLRRVIVAAALLSASPAAAAAADRVWPVASFDRLQVEGPIDVDVASGSPKASASAADRAMLDRMTIAAQGNVLISCACPGLAGPAQARATLATPRLSAVRHRGPGTIAVARLSGIAWTCRPPATARSRSPRSIRRNSPRRWWGRGEWRSPARLRARD